MIRKFQQARQILRDWLGEGCQTVPLSQAQARANVCLQCPKNYQGSWLWAKGTALAIGRQMELRRVMSLHLAGEERLNICEVCGCQLKLKLHVPFIHIYRHTPDAMWPKYPDFCWQLKELQQLQPQPKP